MSVTNAASGVSYTTYDLDNNVLTTDDMMGNVTTNVWNSRNELTQQTLPDPDGSGPLAAPVLSFTYSATGQELTATDSLGRVTSMTYDNLGRLTQKTLPDPDGGGPLASPVIIFGYDNLSRQVSEENPLAGTTHTAYGNADISQVTSVTAPDPDGGGPLAAPVTQYGYDLDGRQNTVENAMGHTTTTTFTDNGQVASVEDNLSNTTAYAYGHGGELLTTTDPLTHASSDEYESRYRLIQSTDANGAVTRMTLDGVGNITALVDSVGNETDWTYNSLNLRVTEANALGTTAVGYNGDSLVTSIQDADGRIRDFAYNNDRQLVAENWMSGTTVIASMAYGYDLASEMTSASDPNSAYAFAYNGDGDVTSVDNNGTPNVPHVVLASGYDAAGDLTSQSATIAGTNDFLNTYSYDADQRLTMVQQQGQSGGNIVSPKEIDYAYNALGQFTSVKDFSIFSGPRLDVSTGAYSYDGDDRLTGLAYSSNAGATTVDSLGWSHNAGSLITSFTSTDGTASYGYDSTDQLTAASYTTASGGHQPGNESYSFDLNGNRAMTGYSTGSDNLLTSDGTFNYTHDADGNTVTRTRISSATASDYLTTYTWDYRNRLTDVDYYDNSHVLTKHVHYVYGVFDHLIATDVDSTGSGSYDSEQHYVLDVSPELPAAGTPGAALALPVLRFDASNTLTALHQIYAEGAVSSLTSADTAHYDLGDNLGSLRYVVDSSGNVIDHVVDNAFGETAYESDPTVDHFAGFAGGHIDPNTGLVNEDHRWYDPATGTWRSQDPDGFWAGDANLHRYVRNQPSGKVDPLGLIDIGPDGTPGTYQSPSPPPITNPSGTWTWQQWAAQSSLSASQLNYAQQNGCWGLMLGLINAPQITPIAVPRQHPLQLPGMNIFGSYSAANGYMQNTPNAQMIAFQFNCGGPAGGQPWTTPTPGGLTYGQLPPIAQNRIGNGCNWGTLQNGANGQQYWTFMNQGAVPGTQYVYNNPLNPNSLTAGLNPQGSGYTNTVFAVYVPPPPPSIWQIMWRKAMQLSYTCGQF